MTCWIQNESFRILDSFWAVLLDDSFWIHSFRMTGSEWIQNESLRIISSFRARHSGRLILNLFIQNDVLSTNSEWVIQNFKFILSTSFCMRLILNSFIQNDVLRINSEWVIQNDVLNSEWVTRIWRAQNKFRILNDSFWIHSEHVILNDSFWSMAYSFYC